VMEADAARLTEEIRREVAVRENGQLPALLREAREEALAEAKTTIRRLMLEALLEAAAKELRSAAADPRPLLEAPPTGEGQRIAAPQEATPAQPAEDEDRGCGFYVYGVTRTEADVTELPEGIGGLGPVYALAHRGLQAAVSRVPLSQYGEEELPERMRDMSLVEADVRAHEAVVEALCRRVTVVPMRFCTIFCSEDGVRGMLAEHYYDFEDAITRLDGRQEWGVKVWVDRERLAQGVEEARPEIVELKAKLVGQSPGAAYLARKGLERTIAEAMDTVVGECADGTHDRLSAHAEEAVPRPVPQAETIGAAPELILNGAYLVPGGQVEGFRRELEALREEFEPLGFRHELTGPWPLYSFVGGDGQAGASSE